MWSSSLSTQLVHQEGQSHTLPECKTPDLTVPEACPVTTLYCLIISSKLKSYWHTVLEWSQHLVERLIPRISFIRSSRSTLPLCSLFCASWGWTVLTTSIGLLASDFHLDLANRKHCKWSGGRREESKMQVFMSLDWSNLENSLCLLVSLHPEHSFISSPLLNKISSSDPTSPSHLFPAEPLAGHLIPYFKETEVTPLHISCHHSEYPRILQTSFGTSDLCFWHC